MDTCPYCSHNLLNHLRAHSHYWYCSRCRLETADSIIAAQKYTATKRSRSSGSSRLSAIDSQLAISSLI